MRKNSKFVQKMRFKNIFKYKTGNAGVVKWTFTYETKNFKYGTYMEHISQHRMIIFPVKKLR